MNKKAFPFLILFMLIPILVLSQIRVDNNGVSTFENDGIFLSEISVSSHATIGSSLRVDGTTSLLGSLTNITNDATIGGVLTVYDDVSLLGTLTTVDGNFLAKGRSAISANLVIGSTGNASGNYKLKVICNSESGCYGTNPSARYGVHSVAKEAPGYESAYGVYGEADSFGAYGVYGYASGGYARHGVYGKSGGGTYNYGVRGYVTGSGYNNYGVYGYATGGTNNWAGYFSGNVYTTGSYQSSDERLKKNIRDLNNTDILDRVLQINPKRYQYLNESELKARNLPVFNTNQGERFGLLAQDVEQVFPELVMDILQPVDEHGTLVNENTQTTTTKAINYQEFTIVLLAAIQEQNERIEALEKALKDK